MDYRIYNIISKLSQLRENCDEESKEQILIAQQLIEKKYKLDEKIEDIFK